ncbi:414db904-b851-4522-a7b2-82997706d2d7 [Sclerotinia trifoliorum]|uniref:414db904-b851-4522-a7b2-82997706d2d7 n=1 Tax=Sclerotinia trifoliorum TaxID=28548 RepID=A0A8H2ZXN5_9HELO|nr:414db904-b851-4522-a7b2-82997706d2d7 [Sclerotinia trifoliorum]
MDSFFIEFVQVPNNSQNHLHKSDNSHCSYIKKLLSNSESINLEYLNSYFLLYIYLCIHNQQTNTNNSTFSMSTRLSCKVQVVYRECGHDLIETHEIPPNTEVPAAQTPKEQKRNSSSSSRSSRRSSWKSFLCSGVEQAESDSDNDADLDFQCKGPDLVRKVEGMCPACSTRRQDLLIAQEQARDAEIIRAHVAQEQDEERARQRRAYRPVEDRHTNFRCEKCIRENRNSADRSGNEGFCCEFGRSFWNKKCEAERFSNTTAGLKRMTIGTVEARRAARQAAASYGWKSHTDEFNTIEPEVVSQFLGITGSEPGSLPGLAVPRYEDAHIDIERWNSQIQTSRGTAPPPNKPLPLLPLMRKPRAEQVGPQPSTGRHAFRNEVPPLRTRDSDVSAMTSPLDLDDVSSVSSMSTRWSSNSQRLKTREGQHNLRRQMTDLEYELDSALESWQQRQPEQRGRRSKR